jgi:hypothetical protein
MERSILFLTLSLACFYLILDEFVGKKRITSILGSVVSGGGNGGGFGIPPEELPGLSPHPVDPKNPFAESDIERGRLTSTGIDDKLISPTRKSGVFL